MNLSIFDTTFSARSVVAASAFYDVRYIHVTVAISPLPWILALLKWFFDSSKVVSRTFYTSLAGPSILPPMVLLIPGAAI